MRGLRQLTLMNLTLYAREPISVFFTLAFPPMLVVLFGAIYGNAPLEILGGRGSMDVSMPAYTALILGTVGFMGIPITISAYRETGVLRRFQAAGVRSVTYIIADVTANLIMTLLGMCGLLVVGWLLYHVSFEGRAIDVIVAVVFGGLAMFSCGYMIASLARGARTAQVVGMVIFYPMMFLSGAGIPLEVLPAGGAQCVQCPAADLCRQAAARLVVRRPLGRSPGRDYRPGRRACRLHSSRRTFLPLGVGAAARPDERRPACSPRLTATVLIPYAQRFILRITLILAILCGVWRLRQENLVHG